MTEKMTIAVFTGPGQLEFREIPRPVLKPNQVLVKIRAVAICTVERRAWTGTRVSGLGKEFVGGHETAGEVVEVGEAVIQGFEPGDKVVMGLGSDCGACYYCRRGQNQRCEHFREIYGQYAAQYGGLYGLYGFSEYRAVNENEIFKTPGDVPFEQLALAEPLSCAIHSSRKMDIQMGDDVVIIGAGAMGLLNLVVTNLRGARTIVSEMDPERLEKALRVGANAVVNAAEGDPIEQIKALTEGRGAGFVITAFGSGKVNEQALKMLIKGGTLMLFAAAYPSTPLNLDPNHIHHDEYIITGSTGKDPDDLRIAAKLLSKKIVNVAPMIETVMPFKDLEKALDTAVSKGAFRVVVTMD
jgi:L-iditol 2-dehydrogenase